MHIRKYLIENQLEKVSKHCYTNAAAQVLARNTQPCAPVLVTNPNVTGFVL